MFKESTYQAFSIKNQLSVVVGKGGLPFINVNNDSASALISIYGGQVLSYKKKVEDEEQKDLLFVSELAVFEDEKAIRGGIPICWPWFGKDPKDLGRGMHGFARKMLWQLDETASLSTDENKIVLSLTDTEETQKLFPHEFKLLLIITVGKTLRLSLESINTGTESFELTQALHTYFSIADITQVHVGGLDNIEYFDKLKDAPNLEKQIGNVTVDQEVDRIYVNVPPVLKLSDSKLQSDVSIQSGGSKTAIVWNPWIDKSKRMADLADDSYHRFICVETANAAEDVVVVEAEKSSVIEVEYSIA